MVFPFLYRRCLIDMGIALLPIACGDIRESSSSLFLKIFAGVFHVITIYGSLCLSLVVEMLCRQPRI